MLILTRRPGEMFYIGDQVTVTVLGVVGNQVRFGVDAPRSITVDRAEIHDRKVRAALGNANGNTAHGRGPAVPAIDRQVNGNVDPDYVPPVDEKPPAVDDTPAPPPGGNTLGLKGLK